MTDSQPTVSREAQFMVPKTVGFPIVAGLILVFVILGFPWDSLARRVAWEVSEASGGQVTLHILEPAWTARGPVLRARGVEAEHPAIGLVHLAKLEIAPRRPLRWLAGNPTLRIWADGDLGVIDGMLGLGDEPSFIGDLAEIDLARLPLRIDANGLRFTGQLDGEANVALDPEGTLHGRLAFRSRGFVAESDLLPMAIPFSRAEGVIVILEDGSTQIESLAVEGDLIEGSLSGEIGLVHHSQSPPIDLLVRLHIVDEILREFAPDASIAGSPDGEISAHVRGTIAAPKVELTDSPSMTTNRTRARLPGGITRNGR